MPQSGSTGPGLPALPAPHWYDWLFETTPPASPNATTPGGAGAMQQSVQNFLQALQSKTPYAPGVGVATPGDRFSQQSNPGLPEYYSTPHYTKQPIYDERHAAPADPMYSNPNWRYPMRQVQPSPDAYYPMGQADRGQMFYNAVGWHPAMTDL